MLSSRELEQFKDVDSISFVGAEQVLRPPADDLPYLRHDHASDLIIEPGELTIANGRFNSFIHDADADLQIDASGCAVIPGFVDCHTHLPFIGWRAQEYEQKVTGVAYEQIARSGGGIASSARAFSSATDEEVLNFSAQLAAEMLHHGTTTFECKSGYGLSVESELRALRLAGELSDHVRQNVAITALLAHAVPPGFDADTWMTQVEVMLPQVFEQTNASALDIYIESVAFTNEHFRGLGELAHKYGVALRSHVEQFNDNDSTKVALEIGARSVEHLSCLNPDMIEPLAQSECAAVLLPGAEFLGNEQLAPGRALADAGAICVLATDANPGTSPILSLPLIIGLAVRRYNWTAAEAVLAATLNAAYVLERSNETGSIEIGKKADVVLLDGPIEHIPYRFGHNPVAAVFIAGQPAHIRPDSQWRFKGK